MVVCGCVCLGGLTWLLGFLKFKRVCYTPNGGHIKVWEDLSYLAQVILELSRRKEPQISWGPGFRTNCWRRKRDNGLKPLFLTIHSPPISKSLVKALAMSANFISPCGLRRIGWVISTSCKFCSRSEVRL
jgi:hypothetical protein